jgi:hypothetical protein
MQLQIRPNYAAVGPALLGFLHTVFPEHTLAGGKCGVYPVIRLSLADRHNVWAIWAVRRAG